MPPDKDEGVYVMSVAAQLTGLHPQTLRLYERRGLVEPARTEGGNRRYSETDLEQLHRITQLTDDGINIEGVRRVLELEAQLAAVTRTLETLRSDRSRAATRT